jgi:hypothetical protein
MAFPSSLSGDWIIRAARVSTAKLAA